MTYAQRQWLIWILMFSKLKTKHTQEKKHKKHAPAKFSTAQKLDLYNKTENNPKTWENKARNSYKMHCYWCFVFFVVVAHSSFLKVALRCKMKFIS